MKLIKRNHIRGDLFYPNCPISKALIEVMGRKAFKEQELPKIKQLHMIMTGKELVVSIEKDEQL